MILTGPADRARRDAAPLMPCSAQPFRGGIVEDVDADQGAICLLAPRKRAFAPALSGISQRAGAFFLTRCVRDAQ